MSNTMGNDSGPDLLDGHPAGVPVRDPKNPQGPALAFRYAAWSAFITDLKHSGR